MPPRRRDSPACSAADENVGHVSTTACAGTMPASIPTVPASMVTVPPKLSLPVNRRSTSAEAALKVLWPETSSPNGGVGR